MRVLVRRTDGFSGPITIFAATLPKGVTCPPVTISSSESTARIVFAAQPNAPAFAGNVVLHAVAQSDQQTVKQQVAFGSILWGAPDYNTSRVQPALENTMPLAVSNTEITPTALAVTETNLQVKMGEKLTIPVTLPENSKFTGNLAVVPIGLRGLSKPPTVNIDSKKKTGTLTLDFTAKKGTFSPAVGKWNFILRGSGTTSYRLNPEAEARAAKALEAAKKAESKDTKALEAALAAAKKKAAPQNRKFTVWSLPLVVEVTEAAK